MKRSTRFVEVEHIPSMKVPPKRKGNLRVQLLHFGLTPLNESPSEKEGKFHRKLHDAFRQTDPQ